VHACTCQAGARRGVGQGKGQGRQVAGWDDPPGGSGFRRGPHDAEEGRWFQARSTLLIPWALATQMDVFLETNGPHGWMHFWRQTSHEAHHESGRGQRVQKHLSLITTRCQRRHKRDAKGGTKARLVKARMGPAKHSSLRPHAACSCRHPAKAEPPNVLPAAAIATASVTPFNTLPRMTDPGKHAQCCKAPLSARLPGSAPGV